MKRALPLLMCLAMAAAAKDLTTTDGRTYKKVSIRKVEPDGLAITHESGLAKVPFAKLSKELQKEHGYDPEKAAKFAKERAATVKATEEAIEQEIAAQQAQEKAKREWVPNDPPGLGPVPLEKVDSPPSETKKPARLVLGKKGKKQPIGGRVSQVVPEGLLFTGGMSPWLLVRHPQQRKLADGSFIKCYASKTDGVYQYVDVVGGQRTVAVWVYAGKRMGK